MIVTQEGYGGRIECATTDCGRVVYNPFDNGIVQIDGRRAWRGFYTRPDGRATDEAVADDLWALACTLFLPVAEHNQAVDNRLREAAFAKRDAWEAREIAALEASGFYREDDDERAIHR